MKRKSQRGLTLIELIVAFTILMVLTTMAIPMARFRIRREHERDLRLALYELRTAIDKYKDACDGGKIATTKIDTFAIPTAWNAGARRQDRQRPQGQQDPLFAQASPATPSPIRPIGA